MPWGAVKGWHLSNSEKSIIGDQKSIISARLSQAEGKPCVSGQPHKRYIFVDIATDHIIFSREGVRYYSSLKINAIWKLYQVYISCKHNINNNWQTTNEMLRLTKHWACKKKVLLQ